MKVVHFCPIYIDGWGYQENLLPLYFKKKGHEVCVITPNKLPAHFNEILNHKKKYCLDGVEIRRIDVFCYLSFTLFITRKLYKNLKELKPDILFHHGLGLTSLLVCGIYRIFHSKCVLLIDNHIDEINQNTSKIWLFFYSKLLLSLLSNLLSPFIQYFYGVSYGRCDYLESVFKVNKNKIKLLPIGADTLAADNITLSNNDLRLKFKIPINNIVVISGGKMGKDKGTDLLIKSIEELNSYSAKFSLILFGSFNDEITMELANNSEFVVVKGWCDRQSTLELLKLSDIAVWPIHHTTLIEDSISCLTPLILRKTRTTEHLIDGNGIFIEKATIKELKDAIVIIIESESNFLELRCKTMRDKIDYRNIVNTIVNDSIQN